MKNECRKIHLILLPKFADICATANSTRPRIPELVHLDNSFKSKPLDQAELFNKFFYDQFSEPSLYDTNVDHSNSQDFFIDFNASRVFSILSDLNPNKALGPDKIHGLKFSKTALGKYQNLSPFYLQKASIVAISQMHGNLPWLCLYIKNGLNQM